MAAVALAALPSNDDRADARSLSLPASVRGSTEEATLEESESRQFSRCGEVRGSVWYSVPPGSARRISICLAASGDLDAVIDVFRPVRSRLDPVTCETTDDSGDAALTFGANAYARRALVSHQPRTGERPLRGVGAVRPGHEELRAKRPARPALRRILPLHAGARRRRAPQPARGVQRPFAGRPALPPDGGAGAPRRHAARPPVAISGPRPPARPPRRRGRPLPLRRRAPQRREAARADEGQLQDHPAGLRGPRVDIASARWCARSPPRERRSTALGELASCPAPRCRSARSSVPGRAAR